MNERDDAYIRKVDKMRREGAEKMGSRSFLLRNQQQERLPDYTKPKDPLIVDAAKTYVSFTLQRIFLGLVIFFALALIGKACGL